MEEIKRVYPDVRSLVGNSVYVKASVLTKSGKHFLSVSAHRKKDQKVNPLTNNYPSIKSLVILKMCKNLIQKLSNMGETVITFLET